MKNFLNGFLKPLPHDWQKNVVIRSNLIGLVMPGVNRDKLVEQCEQFGIVVPQFPELDQLRDEIEEYQKNWSLYGSFLEGLEKMTQEDWISFRVKINSFQVLKEYIFFISAIAGILLKPQDFHFFQ